MPVSEPANQAETKTITTKIIINDVVETESTETILNE